MPDENKFAKLREAGYRIPESCLLCTHSSFPSGGVWGVCGKITYDHGKHVGGLRGVSILQHGVCDLFEEQEGLGHRLGLGSHEEFLPGREPQDLPPSKGKRQKKR